MILNFELSKMEQSDIRKFKRDIQESFQNGFEEVYGKTEDIILPEADIERSLNAIGSIAYKAVVDGEMVGGAVVVINENTQHNHLDLLYVKSGIQAKGIGYSIWNAVEKLHPYTKVWETCTPYFEKRNIHFYVNKCGFQIDQFWCQYFEPENEMQNDAEHSPDEGPDEMFHFKKVMK